MACKIAEWSPTPTRTYRLVRAQTEHGEILFILEQKFKDALGGDRWAQVDDIIKDQPPRFLSVEYILAEYICANSTGSSR